MRRRTYANLLNWNLGKETELMLRHFMKRRSAGAVLVVY